MLDIILKKIWSSDHLTYSLKATAIVPIMRHVVHDAYHKKILVKSSS